MRVRPAVPGDRVGIARLIGEMGGHDEIGLAEDPLAHLALVLSRSDARALVADEGGRMVGYVDIQARGSALHDRAEAWLGALAVDPARRGEGVGRTLLAAIEEQARWLGCDAMVLESSTWRQRTPAFYEGQGFSQESEARRFTRAVPSLSDDSRLELRFLDVAARAATAAAAVAGRLQPGALADGGKAADAATEAAVIDRLRPLGLPIAGEEGAIEGRPGRAGEYWILVDPIDGTRNYRAGQPPWATSIALVLEGAPVAGLVCDLAAGRRWWSDGTTAFGDGRPLQTRPSELLLSPSPAGGALLRCPPPFERVRISGCTSVDICQVAAGAAGGFDALEHGTVFAQDVAASWAILKAAGGCLVDAGGQPPVLTPDVTARLRVAAWV